MKTNPCKYYVNNSITREMVSVVPYSASLSVVYILLSDSFLLLKASKIDMILLMNFTLQGDGYVPNHKVFCLGEETKHGHWWYSCLPLNKSWRFLVVTIALFDTTAAIQKYSLLGGVIIMSINQSFNQSIKTQLG